MCQLLVNIIQILLKCCAINDANSTYTHEGLFGLPTSRLHFAAGAPQIRYIYKRSINFEKSVQIFSLCTDAHVDILVTEGTEIQPTSLVTKPPNTQGTTIPQQAVVVPRHRLSWSLLVQKGMSQDESCRARRKFKFEIKIRAAGVANAAHTRGTAGLRVVPPWHNSERSPIVKDAPNDPRCYTAAAGCKSLQSARFSSLSLQAAPLNSPLLHACSVRRPINLALLLAPRQRASVLTRMATGSSSLLPHP